MTGARREPTAGTAPPTPPYVLQTRDPARASAALGRLLTVNQLNAGHTRSEFSLRMAVGTSGALTVVTAHLTAEGWAEAAATGQNPRANPTHAPGTGTDADAHAHAHAVGLGRAPARPTTSALVTSTVLTGLATFTGPHREVHRLGTGEVRRLETSQASRVDHDAGTTFANLVLPARAVADAAADAGRDVAEDTEGRPVVVFAGYRPYDEQTERYWAALTRVVAQQVAGTHAAPNSPLLQAHLVDTVARAALVVFPTFTVDHPYGPGFTGPTTVRQALEHLHAHAGQPLSTSDLAATAGIGVRALQQAFVQHVGTTPSAYLRRLRLERAHADLLAGDPTTGDSVTTIATRWGFAHLGRFAADYRRRYGVLPSTTLRR